MTDAKTGAAKFTIQKFYLPSGSSTQLAGVVPDIILPSLEDVLESGERFLPQALVWDEIKTTDFNGAPLETHILAPLREASLARQESLPEFEYLRENIKWFSDRQEEDSVSLNLEERIAQRDADKAFRESMDERRKQLRDLNYRFTECLLTPPEEEEAKIIEFAQADTSPTDMPADTEAATDSDDPEVLSTDEQPEPEGYARLDIHLKEAVRVLRDAVEIGRKQQYAEHAPLTARTASGG